MIKKIIIFIIIIICSSLYTIAQKNDELTNAIISSLTNFYNYHLKSENRTSMFYQNKIGDTSIYLSVKNYPFNIIEKLKDSTIKFVDFNYSVKYCYHKTNKQKHTIKKEIKKGIPVIFLDEIRLIADTLSIAFSYRSVSYNSSKKVLYIGISDWGHFKYIYLTEEKRWILLDTKFGGI